MRRFRLALFAGLLAAGAAFADEPAAQGRAFVEVTTPRDTVFVGERLRVVLRLGVDAEFFRASAVPLFRQPLDVPVQVAAPWVRALRGAVALPPLPRDPADARPRLRFALDDDAAEATEEAERVRDGRAFRVLTLERTFLPEAPGDLTIAAPTLRFAYATAFQEDFVNGRVAVDRHDVTVVGTPVVIHVRALPEEGRPPEFRGAVGRFTVSARTDRARVEVGEIFRLTLLIEGEGNLEVLDPPRLDALTDFHVYGTIDDRGGERRTIAYDLAALKATVTDVPPIPFAFFDPAPATGYRVVRTERLPLEVAPRPGDATPAPVGAAAGRGRGGVSPAAWVAGFVALCALAFAVGWRRRALRRAASDPATARARAAAAVLRARMGAGDASPADAFAEFLASLLQCPPAAVIAPDLATRLRSAGIPAPLASRAAATLEGLVAARYGGGDAGLGGGEVVSLSTEIETSFGTPRRPRGAPPGP